MMAGVVIQDKTQLPIQFWFAAIAVCAVTVVVLMIRGTKQAYAGAYLALICFACLGAIRLTSFYRAKPNDIRNLVGSEPTLATVRGVIASEPYPDSNEWRFSRFTPTDRGSSFYLEITDVETVDGWTKSAGLVRVRVNESVLDLKPGNFIQMYCWLDRFGGATNPGEFDIAKYLAAKGVFVAASVESRDAIELLRSNTAGVYAKIRGTLQRIAIQALMSGSDPREESEKLLLALVLGYRADIDKTILEAFRQTGLLHFVCLSGMNFAMVIGFVWWVCKTAGLLKRGRAIVCIIAAVLFLLVVPENAPAFRAGVMCFAFCGAFIFRRKSNLFNSLALAAVVLLLIRPTGLFEAGWQLSFVSVLGILALCPRFYPILRERTIDQPWFADFMKARPHLPRILTNPWPYSLFSTSFTAWLATAGIMLYHFYTIQWLTSIWTVLVSPLIGVVSILGYLKLIIAIVSPTIATALGIIANILADLLIYVVKLIAGLNISEILIGKTGVMTILLFYGLIVFSFFFRLQNLTLKKAVCVISAMLILAMLALPKWQKAHNNNLTVTVLDVGHGQAILAQLPGGNNMLFDAGSLSRNDIGSRVVLPFLRYNAIGKIDAVIISHGDIDHINGLPEIADGVIYAGDVFFDEEHTRPTVQFLHEEMRQKGIEIKPADDKMQTKGPAVIKLLWPVPGSYEINQVSDNDKSLVMMIEFAGGRIFLCSDIEKFAQKEVLRLYPDLKPDVLIAPHHGSIKTLEPDFINKLGPDVVICSCGRTAYEKGQAIKEAGNSRLFYTGRDGAVTIRVSKQGLIDTTTFTK
jgi:competence protein ComEC